MDMIQEYIKSIKALRIKRGVSQSNVAKKIEISRPSYIAFEKGKRDLTLTQVQKLADLFGVSLEELENGTTADLDKYKEMVLAYLRKATSPDGKIPKTKLAKLLYLADFAWFYKNLQSMSGMQYRRLQYGPVPDLYFRALDELEDSGKIKVDRKGEALLISENSSSMKNLLPSLNKAELGLINDISRKWKERKTNEIVDFTHNQLPYKICVSDEIIPYELITQEDPEHVY